MIVGYARTLVYRYLRFNVTKIITSSSTQFLGYTCQFSPDLGVTNYPLSNMTTNSAPSPLVASTVDSSVDAFKFFDGSNSTFCQFGPTFAGQVPPTPSWFQLDLGAGNGLTVVNCIKFAGYNTGGLDISIVDFNVTGSPSGAFAGEQVTLKSWTGQTSKGHQTLTTYT